MLGINLDEDGIFQEGFFCFEHKPVVAEGFDTNRRQDRKHCHLENIKEFINVAHAILQVLVVIGRPCH